MKNRKINVDRPQLKTEEILARRNFDEVLTNHSVMTKPFYKHNWFIGTTGLASLGLIIGGTFAFQSTTNQNNSAVSDVYITDTAPPTTNIASAQSRYVAQYVDFKHEVENQEQSVPKTTQLTPKNQLPIEENFTPEKNNTKQDKVALTTNNKLEDKEAVAVAPINSDKKLTENYSADKSNNKSNSFLDMSPRISNKMGGTITRNELMSNKGITTEGDITIVHFELHLIDGLGGKVLKEEGNMLNQEMKEALEGVGKGETIYIENIRGKVKNGKEVRLNPLRYVLMN